jgi:hypothetical protein
MATSDEWTEWHLTPNGWEIGAEQTDFNRISRELPLDIVITVRWFDYLGSPFASAKRGHQQVWKSDDTKQIDYLLQKYGVAPKHL